MSEKYILLSGRTASGKTELIVAYANTHPQTTLILSEEYTKEWIQKHRKLNKDVKVVESLDDIDVNSFETICIDYVELFDKKYVKKLIADLMKVDIRIIVATNMKRETFEINNVFYVKD